MSCDPLGRVAMGEDGRLFMSEDTPDTRKGRLLDETMACPECVHASAYETYITYDEQEAVWPAPPLTEPDPRDDCRYPYLWIPCPYPDFDVEGTYRSYSQIVESHMCIRHLVWMEAVVNCEDGLYHHGTADGPLLHTVTPDYVMVGGRYCGPVPESWYSPPWIGESGQREDQVEGQRSCWICRPPVKWICHDFNPVRSLHGSLPDIETAPMLEGLSQEVPDCSKGIVHPVVLTLDIRKWTQTIATLVIGPFGQQTFAVDERRYSGTSRVVWDGYAMFVPLCTEEEAEDVDVCPEEEEAPCQNGTWEVDVDGNFIDQCP